MILIVGLGNPGEDYARTRHNVGRDFAVLFAKTHEPGGFAPDKKLKSLVSPAKLEKEKIAVVLPETFMNRSGEAVGAAARFHKVKPANIFVIHDDADLPLGKAKISFARGAAGHKGVESVIRALKTNAFWRFRIGIGGKRDLPAEKLVLKKFTPEEERLVKKIGKKTISALEAAITEGPEYAMNEYNK